MPSKTPETYIDQYIGGLDVTPAGMFTEVAETSREAIGHHLRESMRLLSQYTGPYYATTMAGEAGSEDSEHADNGTFAAVASLSSTMVFQNPQVDVRSTQATIQAQEARMFEAALQRWVNRRMAGRGLFEIFNEKGAVNALMFPFSAGLIGREKIPGMRGPDGAPVRGPVARNLSPRRFSFDWQALNQDEWRYAGHMESPDRNALLRDAKEWNDILDADGKNRFGRWNIQAIKDLTSISAREKSQVSAVDKVGSDRDDIEIWHIWMPELTMPGWPGPEEGFNGGILTVGRFGDGNKQKPEARWVREPRPYWGPACGPYVFAGMHYVTDSSIPLSNLIATQAQSEVVNRHAWALTKAQEAYKRFAVTRGEELARKVMESGMDWVLSGDGEDPTQITQLEIGGVQPHMFASLGELRDRLDRARGMSDARRGIVTGEGTATENELAAAAAATREEFVINKFRRDWVGGALYRAAWMIWHDPEYRAPLGSDLREQLIGYLKPRKDGQTEITTEPFDLEAGSPHPAIDQPLTKAWYQGGVYEGQGSFDSLEIDFDVRSMDAPNPAMQLAALEGTVQLAPMIRQLPEVDWKTLLEKRARLVNMPELAQIIDLDMSRELMGVPVEPGQGAGDQRFGGDRLPPRSAPGGSGGLGGRGGNGPRQPQFDTAPAVQQAPRGGVSKG